MRFTCRPIVKVKNIKKYVNHCLSRFFCTLGQFNFLMLIYLFRRKNVQLFTIYVQRKKKKPVAVKKENAKNQLNSNAESFFRKIIFRSCRHSSIKGWIVERKRFKIAMNVLLQLTSSIGWYWTSCLTFARLSPITGAGSSRVAFEIKIILDIPTGNIIILSWSGTASL